MFAQSEFLCHLAHDVKEFSIRGKFVVSSDLSSNLSDTQKTSRLESTKKINFKFDLYKITACVEKQKVFHLLSVSHHKDNHSKILNHFPIAQHLSTTRNQCVSRFFFLVFFFFFFFFFCLFCFVFFFLFFFCLRSIVRHFCCLVAKKAQFSLHHFHLASTSVQS